MSITVRTGAEQRLRDLAITLPAPPTPLGAYAEAVQTGNLLFLSGMLPTDGRAAAFVGRVGAELDVATAAQIATLFMSMKFSRDDEYQADSFGIKYAYKAGYDPNGMLRFFTKLQKTEKQGKGDTISNNLRTHPVTSARIDRAKKEIEKITKGVNAEAEAAAAAAQTIGK